MGGMAASPGWCVLVVDDDPSWRELMVGFLSRQRAVSTAKLSVVSAGDCAEAREALERAAGRVALALIDWRLPDGDGLDLALAIKRRWPGTRLLTMTAHPSGEAARRAWSAGVADHFIKPFREGDLRRAVDHALAVFGHRRRSPRVTVELAVALERAPGEPPVPGRLVDLSEGGAFVETDDPRPAGTPVRVTLAAADGSRLQLPAIVDYCRFYDARRPERAPGIGVVFEKLDEETQVRVAALLARGLGRLD